MACGKSDLDIINYLLDNGADIQIGKDSEIGSPLHWAVGEHRLDVTRILLDRGSDINGLNSNNITPLILAAASTDSGMIRLLLERNADPTVSAALFVKHRLACLRISPLFISSLKAST